MEWKGSNGYKIYHQIGINVISLLVFSFLLIPKDDWWFEHVWLEDGVPSIDIRQDRRSRFEESYKLSPLEFEMIDELSHWDIIGEFIQREAVMETKQVREVALQTSWFYILSINEKKKKLEFSWTQGYGKTKERKWKCLIPKKYRRLSMIPWVAI